MDLFLVFGNSVKFFRGLVFCSGRRIRRIPSISMVLCVVMISPVLAFGISFSPPAGQEGSTAVSMDDPAFVRWATGYVDYHPGTDVDLSWQTPELALGPAAGTSFDIVSLGRGGRITLTFDAPIENGDGWDFAVFENAFNDYNLELAYVEVSSNGEDFIRFDAVSLTPGPVGGYGSVDATLIHGLAGKYRQGFGTPFDLSDLSEHPDVVAGRVHLSSITHVRIQDIIGDGTCLDSEGNVIYDPYPTVNSAGFDLDAVGVSNGAPYPEGSYIAEESPPAPEKEGKSGFGDSGGCFIQALDAAGAAFSE